MYTRPGSNKRPIRGAPNDDYANCTPICSPSERGFAPPPPRISRLAGAFLRYNMFLLGHVNRPMGRNRQESDAAILPQSLRKMQAKDQKKRENEG